MEERAGPYRVISRDDRQDKRTPWLSSSCHEGGSKDWTGDDALRLDITMALSSHMGEPSCKYLRSQARRHER